MTRAVHSGYVDGGTRAGRVRRCHIIREDGQFPGRSCLCGANAWPVTRSTPVIIDPMPFVPPAGLTWCPACIGHLAEKLDLLNRVAGRLALASRVTAADRADIALDAEHKRREDGAGEI